jgi:hypothetical protein
VISAAGGEAQLIVDQRASEVQREAVRALFQGEETAPGATVFNVFSNSHDHVARLSWTRSGPVHPR